MTHRKMRKLILIAPFVLAACSEYPATLVTVSEAPLHVELAPLSEHVLQDPTLLQRAGDDALTAIEIAGHIIDNSTTWDEAVAMAESELSDNTDIDHSVLRQTLAAVNRPGFSGGSIP
jgi:hypothetical protein